MSIDLPDHRFATQRAQYLARTTELRQNEAKAVAYSEQGRVWAWIGRELDTNADTVKSWMERAMARYGLEISHTLLPSQLQEDPTTPEYDPVSPDYFDQIPQAEHEEWIEYVERHSTRLPISWVQEVLEEARDRGYAVSTTVK